MRHWQALLLAICSGMLWGCVSAQPVRTTPWLDRFLHPAGPTGPDAVQMDVAIIERPFGDAYINQDLWMDADEQVIPVEARAILEDNGFRIGQIGGITPVGLQQLLTSERSCANPRQIRTLSGKPTKVNLGAELPLCRFQLQHKGESTELAFPKAQCTVEVVPTLTADGRTKLQFTPQVLHGESNLLPRPAADLSGWILKEDRPSERYPQLAFAVSLPPGEYVIVGGRYDKPQTLGHQCFFRTDENNPGQRLLVIRTSRPAKELDGSAASAPAAARSLAARASRAIFRGSSR